MVADHCATGIIPPIDSRYDIYSSDAFGLKPKSAAMRIGLSQRGPARRTRRPPSARIQATHQLHGQLFNELRPLQIKPKP